MDDGSADAALSTVIPLSPDRNVRLKLKGTCNPGDQLCLAAIAAPGFAGMVHALRASAGTYRVITVAEEAGGGRPAASVASTLRGRQHHRVFVKARKLHYEQVLDIS